MTSFNPSTSDEISGDLSLLALGYWMGDLSAEQVALFEQRLAAEQVARDALADVVQVHAGILGAAENSNVAQNVTREVTRGAPAARPKSFFDPVLRWTATAAAAVVVATVLLAWGIGRPWSDGQHSALLYPALLPVAELNSWSSLPVLDAAWPMDEESLELPSTELEVSDWMMAAIGMEDRHSDADAGEETL